MSKAKVAFDTSGFKKKIAKYLSMKADDLRPELFEFVRKSLQTASRNTPVRDYSLIRQNQLKQYKKRVNCIPSSHELVDPSLRINGRQHWLFYRGKWLNAKDWKLSDAAWSVYSQLYAEHERRKQTTQSAFIKERAQARYLYRRSWLDAAGDLGISMNVAQSTRNSHSRRKPQVAPPKARGHIRGGGQVLSVQITNPFLEQPSRYKNFTGKPILAAAMAAHNDQYKRNMRKRLKRIAFAKSKGK